MSFVIEIPRAIALPNRPIAPDTATFMLISNRIVDSKRDLFADFLPKVHHQARIFINKLAPRISPFSR